MDGVTPRSVVSRVAAEVGHSRFVVVRAVHDHEQDAGLVGAAQELLQEFAHLLELAVLAAAAVARELVHRVAGRAPDSPEEIEGLRRPRAQFGAAFHLPVARHVERADSRFGQNPKVADGVEALQLCRRHALMYSLPRRLLGEMRREHRVGGDFLADLLNGVAELMGVCLYLLLQTSVAGGEQRRNVQRILAPHPLFNGVVVWRRRVSRHNE